MAKSHREIKVIEVVPRGPITDAVPPIAVTARIAFTIAPERLAYIDNAWVMAWTREHVLVFWRNEEGRPTALWLYAKDVKRRDV